MNNLMTKVWKILWGMAFLLTLFWMLPADAHAETYRHVDLGANDPRWDVYIDENKNIVIETYDLRKTSNIVYATRGFTISRCKLNEKTLHDGENSQWVGMGLYQDIRTSELVILNDGNIYEHNLFRIPLDDLVTTIHNAGYTEWEEEIRNFYYRDMEDICYLKFDCVMITINNGVASGRIWYDDDGSIATTGKVYMNRPCDKDVNPDAITRAYNWRGNAKLRLIYRFNRYLPEGGTENKKHTDLEETEPVSLYETKNYSSEYDISKAIPSGETVTNEISAASFTGNDLSVGTNEISKKYNVTFTCTMSYKTENVVSNGHYEFQKYINCNTNEGKREYSQYLNKSGYKLVQMPANLIYALYKWVDPVTETVTNTESKLVNTSFNAAMAYQYIGAAPQLYEYDSMTVYNNHFPERATSEGASRTLFYPRDEVELSQVKVRMNLYCRQALLSSSRYQIIEQHMGADINSFDYTPLDAGYHYGFYAPADENNITIDVRINGAKAGDWSGLDTALNKKKQEFANTISNNSWTRNDYCMINDGKTAFVLMSDDVVKGAVITEGSKTWVNAAVAATSDKRYGFSHTMKQINDDLTARRVRASEDVVIPEDADNIDYPTGCSVTYRSLFNDTDTISFYAGLNFFRGESVDSIYKHVMKGGVLSKHDGGDPSDGYPIRVHTPIVSPIKIVDNTGKKAMEKTQLIEGHSYNPSVDNQLLLDKSYFIEWDNQTWLSALWGETPEGYNDIFDKYVQAKYLRFPFTVEYNDTLYRRNEDTGYTDWIKIEEPDLADQDYSEGVDVGNYESANHWQMTPFYIPSFAEEGGTPGKEIYVQAKVEAINVAGRDLGNHADCVQIILNSEKGNYVAETSRCVQLSGWIYDFTLVGTENGLVYNGKGLDDYDMAAGYNPYPLCPGKNEIKSGYTNRLGTPFHRYLSDGSITDTINVFNLLPLRNGSSKAFPGMGAVWRGQDFAYTVKTIANLSGPNDSVQITPTFTYVTPDGEALYSKNGDIKIYVVYKDGAYKYTYDPKDTSLNGAKDVYLADELFEESHYDAADSNSYQFGNWTKTSVENENTCFGYTGWKTLTEQEFMYRKTTSYSFNHISIPASLRYISGEYEQLARNIERQYDRSSGVSGLLDYSGWTNYTAQVDTDVIYSMQQWNSKYVVPSYIKIMDVRNLGGESFDLSDYIDEHPGWIWEDDPNVYDTEGYLIINFDIEAWKDGKPYLKYSGGNKDAVNMWDKEGYNEDPTVPIEDGDVVIIDMEKNVNDYYEPSIFNIN